MVRIQLVGGPTAVLDVGGLRLVTDPTFDPPGRYPVPGGPTLTKLAGPALTAAEIGRPDAVLLSHDQHADNLDRAGRDFLATAPLTLTTPAGAARLGGGGARAPGRAPRAAGGPAGGGRGAAAGHRGPRQARAGGLRAGQ